MQAVRSYPLPVYVFETLVTVGGGASKISQGGKLEKFNKTLKSSYKI
jgi:hypothetical protein